MKASKQAWDADNEGNTSAVDEHISASEAWDDKKTAMIAPAAISGGLIAVALTVDIALPR